MFVKKTRSKNFSYLQIVQSYREDGKSKHRVVANLGRLDMLLENGQLYRIAEKLMEYSGHSSQSINEVEEMNRLHYGQVVYNKLWDKLKIADILRQCQGKSKHSFDLGTQVFFMAVNRLLFPGSNKKSFEQKHKFVGLAVPDNLQHIYRSLDLLAENKEKIEQSLFARQQDLFHLNLDVVFYDVTTFHFESTVSDELKNFGFSKAAKFNEVQVTMGLLINKEGRPVGYELFEGNLTEGKTLLAALEKLQRRFQLDKVVIVADKAMHSKANLHLIREAGYDYIVSSRIKVASQKIKNQIFDGGSYKHLEDRKTGESVQAYQQIEHKFTYIDEQRSRHEMNDHLLVSWSKERATRDKKKRSRLIERAEGMLEKSNLNLTRKNGACRYIKAETEAKGIRIDKEKIDEDARWDGYYAVQYSGQKKNEREVMEQYHQLWRIEECFRVLKTTMQTRPVFVWTPKRVRGHFVLCFLAFLLERTLELKLKSHKLVLSPEQIKQSLNSLQVSEIKHGDEYYYLKGKANSQANKILRALRIKPLKNITPKQEINL